jgi:hypothetical protein
MLHGKFDVERLALQVLSPNSALMTAKLCR